MSGMLDSLKKVVEEKDPDWVENGTKVTKKLYTACIANFEEIKLAIQANDKLSENDRRLVPNRIAILADVHKSNIVERRQPKILRLIEDKDVILENLWKINLRENHHGKKPSKEEYKVENDELHGELKNLKAQNMRSYLEQAIEENILESQKSLASTLRDKNVELESAYETIANLRLANDRLIKQLNR